MRALDKNGEVISTSADGIEWTERTSSAEVAAVVVGDGPPKDPIREIVGGDYKTILEFQRAFPGWEVDSQGWIVERLGDGKRFFIKTNHGGTREGSASDILEDIERYDRLTTGARQALELLGGDA